MIDYNFCSLGNNIFISNYLGYCINENFFDHKDINFIFLQIMIILNYYQIIILTIIK